MRNLYKFIRYVIKCGYSGVLLNVLPLYKYVKYLGLKLKSAEVSSYYNNKLIFTDGNTSLAFMNDKCVVSVAGVIKEEFELDTSVYASLIEYVFDEYPAFLDYLSTNQVYRYRVTFVGDAIEVVDLDI